MNTQQFAIDGRLFHCACSASEFRQWTITHVRCIECGAEYEVAERGGGVNLRT